MAYYSSSMEGRMGLDRDVCGIKRLGHTSNHGALWHGITGGCKAMTLFARCLIQMKWMN